MKFFKIKVIEMTVLSEPSIYRLIRKNNFPKQMKLNEINSFVCICLFSSMWLVKLIVFILVL